MNCCVYEDGRIVTMKKLIIVCEKNSRRYADFLAQLVSLSDDIEGEIVGVKDGAVAAQV